MPPPLAALLCAAFIVWLFRRQSRLVAPMSPGLWVAFAWVAIISSRPVGYWLASGTAAAAAESTDGSFVDRNTYLLLIVLALFVLGRRPIDWSYIFSRSHWLFLFYGYLLLSVVWSDFPFVAFKRWVKEFGNILMILIILTEKDPLQAIRAVFLRCAFVLVPVSVLFIKYFPEMGRYYAQWSWKQMYCGVTGNKNSLGLAAMVSGMFLLWELVQMNSFKSKMDALRKQWPLFLVLGMAVWLLNISESSTSLACGILALAAFFVSRTAWLRTHMSLIYASGLGVILFLIAFTVIPEFRGLIAGLLNRDVTLTNRTVIWEAVLKIGTDPLVGSGFASTWLKTHPVMVDYDFEGIAHSHNGYLETYLHSGIIGVLLLLPVLVRAGRNAVTHLLMGAAVGPLFVSLFLAAIFYNYTEVAFNNCNIIGFCLWIVAAAASAPQLLQARSFQESLGETPLFASSPPPVESYAS